MLNGELIIKLLDEDQTADVNGKEWFGFEVSMPKYDRSGDLIPTEPATKVATLKLGTNEFKMKSFRIALSKENMVSSVLSV